MILTVIEHEMGAPLDRFADWLTQPVEHGDGGGHGAHGQHGPVTLRVVRAWAGDLVPRTVAEVGDGLVVLGGDANVHDDARCPWLPATRGLLATAVGAGLPTLGLCLGAQLLAVATGGCVQVSAPPGPEVGVVHVHGRPAAADDALLRDLPAVVTAGDARTRPILAAPTMHSDSVVELPPGAVWLASSRQYPYQAFRVGQAAWGLQFHPEVSEVTFAAWSREHDDQDTEALLAELRRAAPDVEAGGRAIAQRFVQIVARARAERAAHVEGAGHVESSLALSR